MVVTESGGVINETGGWRISIGGANGCVFGGNLAGRLIAASPVQVVIGSFRPSIVKTSLKRNNESKSVIVTPTIPNALASTSAGEVQQQEMSDPFLCLNLWWSESGSELNP